MLLPDAPLWLHLRDRGLSPTELLNSFGQQSPPINVVRLARSMGINLYQHSPMDRSAILVTGLRPPVANIVVRAEDAKVRQRFSIAHEIGHLMLHPLGVGCNAQYREYDGSPEEREANDYAANLLMPEWMVSIIAPEWGFDISALADLFKVSKQAMSLRLGWLG